MAFIRKMVFQRKSNASPIYLKFWGNSNCKFFKRKHLQYWRDLRPLNSGAPNGSVPQNICSSGTFLLAGRCGRNNSPWKESVAGKKIIQGVRGDLKSRIAATGYLYGLLTTQDLNCAL